MRDPAQCGAAGALSDHVLFGGADLKTLYITTARENRAADELAREPLAGCVLQLQTDVAGLPASLANLKGRP
jgi:sugar lactone lactonase YvrE